VGFRFTAHHIARGYNVTGFVRNASDGTVEMHAQGPKQDVDGFLGEIQERMAGYVREMKTVTIPRDPEYVAFEITF
jgi:acylphosphatase